MQTSKLFSNNKNKKSGKIISKAYHTSKQCNENVSSRSHNATSPTNKQQPAQGTHTLHIRNQGVPPPMPLNKYVAYCGICSRRGAVDIIRKGMISVNGTVVVEPATRISPKDNIQYKHIRIVPKKKLVYIALNKPKDYICTHQDTRNRKTVYQLLQAHSDAGLHSIGRLDRHTTGILLFTNDGHLTQQLAHPSFRVQKVYHVTLDKNVDAESILSLQQGVSGDM